MNSKMIVYTIVIAALLAVSFFFSCADMTYSVAPLNRLRDETKKGNKSTKKALKLSENYSETIVTLLFGNNLVNILASSLATLLAAEIIASTAVDEAIIDTSIEFGLLFLLLIFGEILPKALGRSNAYRLSIIFSPFTIFFSYLFYPVCKITSIGANAIVNPVVEKVGVDDAGATLEELNSMVDTIVEEGIFDEDHSELVKNSILFNTITAWDIMTPRVKIIGIDKSTNLQKYIKQPGAFTKSRIIVYDKDFDHILGYIPTKSLQKAIINGKKLFIYDLMLPILAVPGTMEISTILKMMKKSKHHIAVVKDEYGGTDGILTMEDILEEIVGELYDEGDKVPLIIEKVKGRNTYKVSGSMNLDDFNEKFSLGLDMESEDVDTVSGWVNQELGKFAKPGDKFKYKKIDILVLSSDKYTVKVIKVVYHPRRRLDRK